MVPLWQLDGLGSSDQAAEFPASSDLSILAGTSGRLARTSFSGPPTPLQDLPSPVPPTSVTGLTPIRNPLCPYYSQGRCSLTKPWLTQSPAGTLTEATEPHAKGCARVHDTHIMLLPVTKYQNQTEISIIYLRLWSVLHEISFTIHFIKVFIIFKAETDFSICAVYASAKLVRLQIQVSKKQIINEVIVNNHLEISSWINHFIPYILLSKGIGHEYL